MRRQLAVEQVSEAIRQAVLAMRESEDIADVVAVMWQRLQNLDVRSLILSIHFIDEPGGRMTLDQTMRNPQREFGIVLDSPKVVKLNSDHLVVRVNMTTAEVASFHSIASSDYIDNLHRQLERWEPPLLRENSGCRVPPRSPGIGLFCQQRIAQFEAGESLGCRMAG